MNMNFYVVTLEMACKCRKEFNIPEILLPSVSFLEHWAVELRGGKSINVLGNGGESQYFSPSPTPTHFFIRFSLLTS